MNPCLLTFADTATENEYQAFVARRVCQNRNKTFLTVALVITLAGAWRYYTSHAPKPALLLVLWVVYLQWEIRVRGRMSFQEFAKKRRRLVLRCRFAYVAKLLMLNLLGTPMVRPSLFSASLRSGALPNLILTLGLPLEFRYLLPFQIFSALTMLLVTSKTACHMLMSANPPGVVLAIGDYLNLLAECIAKAMYTRFGYFVKAGQCWCQCTYVTIWWQFFVMTIGVPYYLWLCERRSRIAFVGTLPFVRRKREGLLFVTDFCGMQVFMHIVLLFIAFAITWQMNPFIARTIDSWEWSV